MWSLSVKHLSESKKAYENKLAKGAYIYRRMYASV
jgi:hypothetical protein